MRKTKSWKSMILLAVCGLPGFGATFTFNFNSLTGYNVNAGNQASSIASQLTTQLQTVCPGCTVTLLSGSHTVNGVTDYAGAYIDKTYNGENHAVGPTSGSNVVSETLGDTPGPTSGVNNPNLTADLISKNSSYSYSALTGEGYTNQFLATTNDSSQALSSGTNEIVLQFSGLTVSGVSFNYEIFPQAGGNGTFTFEAGKNSNGQDTANSWNQAGVTPSSSGSDGTSVYSPYTLSQYNAAYATCRQTHTTTYCNSNVTEQTEASGQYIGSWSGSISSSTELDFIDWPATIGIDNLSITYTPSASTPEPMSVLLLGTLAFVVFLIARRKGLLV